MRWPCLPNELRALLILAVLGHGAAACRQVRRPPVRPGSAAIPARPIRPRCCPWPAIAPCSASTPIPARLPKISYCSEVTTRCGVRPTKPGTRWTPLPPQAIETDADGQRWAVLRADDSIAMRHDACTARAVDRRQSAARPARQFRRLEHSTDQHRGARRLSESRQSLRRPRRPSCARQPDRPRCVRHRRQRPIECLSRSPRRPPARQLLADRRSRTPATPASGRRRDPRCRLGSAGALRRHPVGHRVRIAAGSHHFSVAVDPGLGRARLHRPALRQRRPSSPTAAAGSRQLSVRQRADPDRQRRTQRHPARCPRPRADHQPAVLRLAAAAGRRSARADRRSRRAARGLCRGR